MSKNIENNEELKFAIVRNDNTGEDYLKSFDKKGASNSYVKWGIDNKLPDFLYDAYLKNSNLQAVIQTVANYAFGEGVEVSGIDNEDLNDTIEKCIFDYILFGGFSVECIRSRGGSVVKINYINVQNVRVNEELTTAYLSTKWGSYSGKDIVELPLYNPEEKQNHFIYFYRGKLTRGINPIPMYIGALKSVEILNATRNFHLNNVNNSFNVSAIINLNNGNIKTKELKEIQERLENNFTGAKNAGKFMLINGGDKEHQATVMKLDGNNFGDMYQALDKSSKEDIFVAFRINPILCGVNVATGFSKEEFAQAYNLYYATVIKPMQNSIVRVFREIGIKITFKPFVINWSE